MILESTITCPHCATAKLETMPTNACQFFYVCSGCGVKLRPKEAIAACSALTGRWRVRRCKANAPASRVLHPAAPGSVMTNGSARASRDCLGNIYVSSLAWWIPLAAILAGLLIPIPIRAVAWTIALAWMGIACILNAKRCGRTHCRYTGPIWR